MVTLFRQGLIPSCGVLLVLQLLSGPTAVSGAELPEHWFPRLEQSLNSPSVSTRIESLSAYFLGVPYRANTLGGGPEQPEKLIVQLDAVDCFTFLDYVEALRRSASVGDFRRQLISVRYRGTISWQNRKHFFSDWTDDENIENVTRSVGGDAVRQVRKSLNRQVDGQPALKGVAVRDRLLTYIPTEVLTAAMLARLQTGDYIGIYAAPVWLDVSHVGILIKRGETAYLRHASSRAEPPRVVDVPLASYLRGKPGIIVLRPKPS